MNIFIGELTSEIRQHVFKDVTTEGWPIIHRRDPVAVGYGPVAT